MNFIYALISFAIGAATNIQSGVNSQIRLLTANAVFGATANFIVGTLLLFVLLLLFSTRKNGNLPPRTVLAQTKWWMWIGGSLGVIYVMSLVVLPPLIGYASFFSMLVAGQLVSSVAMDHMGWLGNPVQRVDKTRALGVLLLLVGAVLVQNT